jgi:hypothetical protein
MDEIMGGQLFRYGSGSGSYLDIVLVIEKKDVKK